MTIVQILPVRSIHTEARITTNVQASPSSTNGLSKESIVDCLHTRPFDHRFRLVKVRGRLDLQKMHEIEEASTMVFDLS